MKRGSWTIWPLSVILEEETHAHHWLNLRAEDGSLFDGDQRVTERGEEGEAKEAKEMKMGGGAVQSCWLLLTLSLKGKSSYESASSVDSGIRI